MELKKIVIHEVIKEQKSDDAKSFLSNVLLNNEHKTERLAFLLNNAFSKDDVVYGIFKQEKNEFYFRFNEYQQKLSGDAFLAFTQVVTEELEGIMKGKFMARGGFLVFAEYTVNTVNFVGVYLIRDVEGMLLEKNETEHTFAVNLTKYMDTNKLAMGCRININKLEDQDSNHLSLIKSGQNDISEYFYQWIGVDKPESNKDYTNRLFGIVSDLPLPEHPIDGMSYSINDIRELAFNNIKSSASRTVNLRQLSIQLYGDENTIPDYVREKEIEIDSEFRYDSKALNRFKRIEANKDGIRLAFSRGDINGKVTLSDEDPSVVILTSKKLADDLRAKINQQ